MSYYQRLKDLKEDADLTQKQVAELIGVSMNHYGKYERGETDIPLEKAVILADYYGVSLDYIAGRTNSKGGLHNDGRFEKLFSELNSCNKNRIEERMLEMLENQKKKK